MPKFLIAEMAQRFANPSVRDLFASQCLRQGRYRDTIALVALLDNFRPHVRA